jgi:hypothetical protein
MKKIITIILLAVFSAAVYSQESNKQLLQLEKCLEELDFGVSHQQSNCGGSANIRHTWQANFYESTQKIPVDESLSEEKRKQYQAYHDEFIAKRWWNLEHAVDSVRLAFARLSKESSKSYLYENHMNNADSIIYALAFARSDGKTPFFYEDKKNNRSHFWDAREAASFNFDKNFNSQGQFFVGKGSYEHVYEIETGLSWENDMKSFDVEAFQALIQPVIKPLLSLKGAKSYPVYWRHDVGYEDEVGNNGGLTQKTTSYGSNASGQGLTTGTFYFIPAQYEAEAKMLHKQLDSLSLAYVNQHPKQPYIYKYSKGYSHYNLQEIVHGFKYHDGDDYSLRSYCSDDGFFILSLTTKGDIWIPRDWPILKSWINGEKVYLKGMAPKKNKGKK